MEIKDIKSVAASANAYMKGEKYFHQNLVQELYWETTECCKGTVIGTQNNYKVMAEIRKNEDDFDGNPIVSYSCNCPAFHSYYGACKHIVAMLLAIRQKEEQASEKFSKTNYFGKIVDFPDCNINGVDSEKNDYTLVPRTIESKLNELINWANEEGTKPLLNDDHAKRLTYFKVIPVLQEKRNNELSLSFTVGTNHQYIVKNISRFVLSVKNGTEMTYGKQKPVIHQLEDFDRSSAQLLRFIIKQDEENYFVLKHEIPNLDREKVTDREILLSPERLDKFYDIWQGRIADFRISSTNIKQVYLVRINEIDDSINKEKNLWNDISLKLIVQKDSMDSKMLSLFIEKACIFQGMRRYYLLREYLMFPINTFQGGLLKRFMQIFEGDERCIRISREDFKNLYSNVIKRLSSLIYVEGDSALLKECMPNSLKATLYLDEGLNGSILGILKFSYGEKSFRAFAENNPIISGRDYYEEEKYRVLIKRYFPAIDIKEEAAVIYRDEDCYFFLKEGLLEIKKQMDIYSSDSFRNIEIKKAPRVGAHIHLDNNWMEMKIDSENLSFEEWKYVLDAYRLKKKYVRLKDGDFLELDNKASETVAMLMQGLGLENFVTGNKILRLPKYRAFFLDGLLKNNDGAQIDADSNFEVMIRSITEGKMNSNKVPESLKNILRDYQNLGYQWLATMNRFGFGGILADDMGLGKSLQILTLLLAEKEKRDIMPHTFITCPASLIYNWKSEIEKFTPQLNALPVTGSLEERKRKLMNYQNYDILITSYDLLRRDIELYKNFFFDFHILDEAQYIKNQNTRSAKVVRKIDSRQRFALTGTPIENNIAELWSVFDFLLPGYLYSYIQFHERFEKPIVQEEDTQALNCLNQMISPFILRRMKSEVLTELPKKTETIMLTEMHAEQRKLYQANLMMLRKDFQDHLKEKGLRKTKFELLSILMRLRQLCCHPRLCYENFKGKSGKLELCMELIKNSVESGHKILLFSQFTSMLYIIKERLAKEKIKYFCLQGDTPKEKRARLVEEFQNNDVPLFLISLKAGGTGLNLTAADIVIHFDPWWNLSAQNQATDRVYRIGQKNRVQVYQLITKGSIEEKILDLQQRKKALTDSIIGKGGSMISSLTADEILALFEN